jgi:hypothetical protein
MPPTPTRLLIETRLGRPLDEVVHEQLAAGKGRRRIAEDIRYRTEISVSHETLRGWFKVSRGAA